MASPKTLPVDEYGIEYAINVIKRMLGIEHARCHDRMQPVAGVSLAGSQGALMVVPIALAYFISSTVISVIPSQ